MSQLYDNYLEQHKGNVVKGFKWLQENLPGLIGDETNVRWQVMFNHDASKTEPDEYDAYDVYFYGGNRSYAVVQAFNLAWLKHIHRNPHHWQYWVLINDDPELGEIVLDMPIEYIIEMICDWWAFSWNSGNLYEIFSWWEEHKGHIKLSESTRKTVVEILALIKSKLDETTEES